MKNKNKNKNFFTLFLFLFENFALCGTIGISLFLKLGPQKNL